MTKGFPRTAAAAALRLIVFPVAVASAGPYTTTSVSQASSTSPFASCDVSAFMFPGEVNWVNSELEPFVAVNPKDPSNIIGVYQQDRFSFGGATGLAASVSHDGGLTWSTTYPHFTTCSGGTAANSGDYQRASDPWVTFSPDGTAYFISLSLTFVGDATQTGIGGARQQVDRRRRHLERARRRSSATSATRMWRRTSSTTRSRSPPIRSTRTTSTRSGTGCASRASPRP